MKKIIFKIILILITSSKPLLIKIFSIEKLRQIKRKLVAYFFRNKIRKKQQNKFDATKFLKGINLIGFIKGEIGLGQSCRLVADAITSSEVDFTIYNYDQISSIRQNDESWNHKISNTTPYGVNLWHLNPPELILAQITMSDNIWKHKYNIGYWLWELEKFPEDWKTCFSLVDEIWTPSEYISNIMRQQTDLPVKTIIYPITAPTSDVYNREYFNLPKNCFLYLTMYDSNSTMERKNPIGAINAYKKSFDKNEKEVGLIIKINNAQNFDLEKIKKLCEGYKNIFIISNILTKVEVNSLIKCADVLISLHRAEGFGLPLAEAMLLGTPTIATNWSANTEFMNDETGCLVDYELVKLKEDYAMYKKGSMWAEPNILEASKYIRKLYNDKNFYNNISKNGKKYIETHYSRDVVGELITKRIQDIYGG